MSSEPRPAPEEMARDELEQEVEHLRDIADRVDELEARLEFQAAVEFRGEDQGLENLWIGNQPVGKILAEAERQSKDALKAAQSEGESCGATAAARESALDVHVNWFDLRDGRGDRISENRKRAAVLFHRFILKAAGESNVGVESSHGKYRMTGSRARQILEADGHVTMPADGKSKTIKRVMGFVQKGSKREDCGCSNFDRCKHGLVVFKRDDGYSLTADSEAFHQYLTTVDEAVEVDADPADDTTAADGSRGPGDDVHQDVEEQLQQLEVATPEREFADSVVSSSSGRLSAATSPAMEDETDD